MLNQILVLSPEGPCFVYRDYDNKNEDKKIDPQIISAMIALKSSGTISLSTVSGILEKETENKQKYAMEVSNTHNYITCAVSSNHSDSKSLRQILPKINQMIYENLGSPRNVSSIDKEKIQKMEDRIDLIMLKEGFIGS